MVDHDGSYHLLFSNPKMVEDLFRSFVPEPWVEQLDFSTLQRVNAKLHAENLERREGDMIYRINLLNGHMIYIYLLLEFQSRSYHWMSVRVGTYAFLLYEHLIREKQITREGGLPPIFPLVLYNGTSPWKGATELSRLIALPESTPLRAYQPNIGYYLLEVRQYPEPKTGALSELAFALENCRDVAKTVPLLDAMLTELAKPYTTSLRRAFSVWVKYVLSKNKILAAVLEKTEDLLEVRDMITENLSHWENNLRHQGFEKGAKKGFEKGESSLLCQLIEHRFGPLPDWARVKLDEADTQTLERWGLQLLEAEKLEDVFG